MGFRERLQVILDVDANGANTGLKGFISNFRTSIAQAEGGIGKFKAGWSAASSAISKNAGILGVATGTALVAAGVKGVQAFEDTARAALNLGKATGLTTEQASRWIAVADDAGVSAEQLGTSIGRMDKTLNSSSWEKYGIATHDAAGNVRDANSVFVDAMSKLSAMTDTTARAQAGQELFGKGWAGLAPMIGHTRAEYQQMLGAVSDGQVITDGEAAKSEKWRLAMDNLQDSLGDVGIALGELVADGAPVLNLFARLTGAAAKLVATATGGDAKSLSKPIEQFHKAVEGLDGSDEALVKTLNALAALKHEAGSSRASLDQASRGLTDLFAPGDRSKVESLDNLRLALAQLAAESPADARAAVQALFDLKSAADAGNDAAKQRLDDWGLSASVLNDLAMSLPPITDGMKAADDAASGMSDAERQAAYQAAQMRDRVSEATQKVKDLHDEISGDKSLQELKLHLRDNAARLRELADAYAKSDKSAETSARYMEEVAAVTDDSKLSVMDYAAAIGNIPESAVTDIVTNLDPTAPDKMFAQLQQWFAGRKLFVTVEGQIADSALRNALEGRGTGTPTGTPSSPGTGNSGGGHQGRGRESLDGPSRSTGDVILQIDRQTLVTFKNALDQLNRGTR